MSINIQAKTEYRWKADCSLPNDSADYTRSRSLTACPGGLAIATVKRLIVIGAKIAFFEFFYQPFFFH
jgi:hypothetical protein